MIIYTSYFYQIRFFKPYMIPFSTALSDPFWYHNNKGNQYNFLDKRGVLNGLRIRDFRPAPHIGNYCPECIDGNFEKHPESCKFLTSYAEQIHKLDADAIINYFDKVLSSIKAKMQLRQDPIPVLIVHEAPTKKCSEREVILKVLNEKGIICSELQYPIYNYY